MPRDLPLDLIHPTIPASLSKHSIPLSEWMKHNPTYHSLVVGGFVLRLSPTASTPTPQLLLILRASTDYLPNVWEPPGGSVGVDDPTIIHALARELWEETGLRVGSVEQQVWHGDGSDQHGEMTFFGRKGDKWCKLHFVVECLTEDGDYNVVLDAEEHQDWGWFTREEIEKLNFVSKDGLEVVRNAYIAFEEGLKRNKKL